MSGSPGYRGGMPDSRVYREGWRHVRCNRVWGGGMSHSTGYGLGHVRVVGVFSGGGHVRDVGVLGGGGHVTNFDGL